MTDLPDIRTLVRAVLWESHIPPPVAVALSSGIDSTVLLLAAREFGLNPIAYSFTLDDRESTDFVVARRTARTLGVPFVPVILSTDREELLVNIRLLVARGLRKKTAIECTWPMWFLLADAANHGIRTVLTGSACDGHFGVSRKASIVCRAHPERAQRFRDHLFSQPDYAQVATLTEIGTNIGLTVIAPYRHPWLFQAFHGLDWNVVNTPRQKEPLWRAYPDEVSRLGLTHHHLNLQLGDSGIAELFASLTSLPEYRRWKSPVGVYNQIVREVAYAGRS